MLNTLQKKYSELRKSDGFTIIEVMIVLAIAGLIMVVVFLAIPQLQRNQRNGHTREVINRISSEVNNFAGNNNGSYPAGNTCSSSKDFGQTGSGGPSAGGTCFTSRYLSGIDINDPRTGTPFRLRQYSTTNAPTLAGAGTSRQVRYYTNTSTGYRCNGEDVVAASGGRNYALAVALEGGAIYCVDNS